ncbi:hypothetical protein EVB32_212 [Rhizobium phage RHph_TM39]|uniref:Uncharacterized protein n=2 Tax=Cuauhnahuacvirus TaxID=3044696 RepID=A0A7S5RH72_9CAUD|nr:hypothetical protein PQC16_gp226 [Rhizobium phage RHph_TM30]YP_010671375.1 hypothetical protein PQC17_gp226 [Rhizobium phage RHph_Y65]QIG71697.1 hypothetical protein EVB94_226 [Rhizobium phage RHph_TM40]QIG72060.1 hypothetical protein EVB95_226 [Rhizobium phage RHph_TM2_3B]QIG72422.1 hypothetical protein EVB96_226 [Rhizobium phage RHph_TM3_3_6]QIG77200.1 hypothetical protein EVB32_212 [Rhizobium phage RHph_TM39]QIG77812.1 hypothetical protein EVB64_225 [Rhizobium phage RHph_TM61]
MYEHYTTRFKLFDEVEISDNYQYAGDYKGEKFLVTGIKYDRPLGMTFNSHRNGYRISDLNLNIQLTQISRDTGRMYDAPTDEWKEEDLTLIKRNVP